MTRGQLFWKGQKKLKTNRLAKFLTVNLMLNISMFNSWQMLCTLQAPIQQNYQILK
jgi:hypothetical protein